MIQLYPKGQADFSANGIALHPEEAEVTWQIAGRYDFKMTIPREAAEGITFDYGQIIRASVPREQVAAIDLGTVSYYETNTSAKLYSQIPSSRAIRYNAWIVSKGYTAGEKVTYANKNYSANHAIPPLQDVAPSVSSDWTEIPRSQAVPGKEITTLQAGTSVMKVRDFNSEYMEAATLTGYQGYIKISECTATGESEQRTVPAFEITDQLFTINNIDKKTNRHSIIIEAEHISYQLGRTMLDECSVVGVNPATALMFIAGAMNEEYPGGLYTGIDEGEITADWSWENAQKAILDPKSGLLQFLEARIIRNNRDIYVVPNPEGPAEYDVRYGVNLENVHWNGDVTGIVTRIYPYAQREDGSRLALPEKYIDSVLPVPYIRPEALNTGLKVGETITNSDGTEVQLTEDEVLTRMRQAAQDRFDVDHCDRAEVTLELDWVHMPDTEEYRQYIDLRNAAPSEWVHVSEGPMGVDTVVQMTGYTFDPILLRYKRTSFGDKKQQPSVAGYDIKTGAVTNRALGSGAVRGENIQAGAITAREIEAGSITAEQIASKIITAELIAAAAITADEIAAQAITTEKLRAGAVTADKIGAHEITTEKLAAGAVTAATIAAYAITSEKIDAGAVTADKIAAGAINADKISATDINAINAKLGTAAIAIAEIQQADIDYAQVKDLNAQSAFFGQAVFQEAIGGKLYVPRLSVGYAQMIGATIGDLVIQASNGNYYGIDVDMAGNVTATQRTVSAAEIAAGHTTDGRTLVLGTDILATDLTTENIYASHALMDEITAAIINVDQLFAREATISKINALDLSSNTYIRSTIGTWTSGSTITQTINSLDSRISSLGYGTVYFQADEPSHSDLLPGDIWIQSTPNGTWQDVLNDYATWNTINNSVGTWQTLGGVPKMYIWDGRYWQEMYDALLPQTLETEIQQLADQIALRATVSELNELGQQVEVFGAELTIQAQEIAAAVSAVNAKAATYVMPVDPRSAHTVTLGDIWVKNDGVTDWTDVKDKYATWNTVKTTYDTWMEILGAKTYIWNGAEWIETSDRASEIYQRTLIDQNAVSISLIADTTAVLEGEVYNLNALFVVANNAITAEVQRATTAEGGKIDKTSQYQTATDIVSGVQSWITGQLQSESWITQTATGIGAYVSDNAYMKQSGIEIKAAGIEISGSKYVKIKSGGQFLVDSGNFAIDTSGNVTVKGTIQAAAGSVIGGWTLGSTDLHAGTGSNYVAISAAGTYAMWAGAERAASAPWRVKRDGSMTVTKLMILNENGQETEVNLRTYGLWKLNYHVIKSYTQSGGYTSSMTLSNGTTVNFKSATAGWSEAVAMVGNFDLDEEGAWIEIDVPSAQYGQQTSKGYDLTTAFANQYNAGSPKGVTIGTHVSGTMYQATVTRNDDTTVQISAVDCSTPYNDGQAAGQRTGWSSAASMVGTMSEEDDLVTIQVPSASYNQPRTASLDVTYIRTAGSKQGYNSALADSGIPNGGTVYSGGTYYGSLYIMGQSGPERVGSGVVGAVSHTLSPK